MSDLTIIEKLDDIIDSKSDIKNSIENKGQHPTEVLSTYSGLIDMIGTEDLDIVGTDINVYVKNSIPKGSRFVGKPMELGDIEVSVLTTFEDQEYNIYPSASVMSQNGRVIFSLLENNKGRICILRDDGTKYRYIFDVDRDTNITPTSAKIGTHMGINKDGTLALYTITYDNSGSKYVALYVLKINTAYNMESVTLFSNDGYVLDASHTLSNTQIRLGIITNNLILIPEDGDKGGFTALSYTLATRETWKDGAYISSNVVEIGQIFGNEDYSVKPRRLFEADSMCYAIGYGNHDSTTYDINDMEIALCQYHYRGETSATRTKFLDKQSLDYKSTISTDNMYLIVSTLDGSDLYKLDASNEYSIISGPYSFPFSIRQFDGIFALTDNKIYYIISVENEEYQLIDNHNIYNIGTGDILSCTYVPNTLDGTWAGVTQVNGEDVPCIVQGVISSAPINVHYAIELDNDGIIDEKNIYGIATRDLIGGVMSTVKYSFKDEHLNTTASAEDIVIGKSAYSNGEYITGTYMGVLTTDATATSSDIAKDKTAYVKGNKVVGNITTFDSQSTDDIVNARSVSETNTALAVRYTFNGNALFRNGGSITINATKQSVSNAVGLNANKIKRDEKILGVTGTFDGIDYDENVEIAKDILGIT